MWDACVTEVNDGLKEFQDCLDVTMKMMACLRQHEYYDVMTADTADKYADATKQVDEK